MHGLFTIAIVLHGLKTTEEIPAKSRLGSLLARGRRWHTYLRRIILGSIARKETRP